MRSYLLKCFLVLAFSTLTASLAMAEPAAGKKPAANKATAKNYPYKIVDKAVIAGMIAKLRKVHRVIKTIPSYTLIMTKQQRVKGKLYPRERTFVKFKKPFKVYMKWLTGKNKGRELIFAKGWNDNKIRVRERGGVTGFFSNLVGAVNLTPTSNMAMRGNRYPITEFGFQITLKKLLNNIDNYKKRKDKVTIMHEGFKTIGGVRHTCIRLIVPKNPNAGYYAWKTRICINFARNILGEVKCWNWKNRLAEHYTYRRVRLRARLKNSDFDPKNKKYNF